MSIEEVSVHDLKAVLGSVAVFDVREVDEYESGHIPGAVNIPLSTIIDNVGGFTGEETVYVVCQAGARSMRACEFLSAALDDVAFVNVAGGTGAWIASGYEVVTGAEAD